jgi:hypothetical protein
MKPDLFSVSTLLISSGFLRYVCQHFIYGPMQKKGKAGATFHFFDTGPYVEIKIK